MSDLTKYSTETLGGTYHQCNLAWKTSVLFYKLLSWKREWYIINKDNNDKIHPIYFRDKIERWYHLQRNENMHVLQFILVWLSTSLLSWELRRMTRLIAMQYFEQQPLKFLWQLNDDQKVGLNANEGVYTTARSALSFFTIYASIKYKILAFYSRQSKDLITTFLRLKLLYHHNHHHDHQHLLASTPTNNSGGTLLLPKVDK